jgi:hypothetical protein
MNEKYANIIDLPHQVSKIRPRMSRLDRAAQFAPYSALSGYEAAVRETARLTDRKTELDDYEKEKIDQTLNDLLASEVGVRASLTFFCPDRKKEGGSYITLTGEIYKIDSIERRIVMVGGEEIKLDDLVDVQKIEDFV